MSNNRKKALGKGLSALLGSSALRVQAKQQETEPSAEPTPALAAEPSQEPKQRVRYIALDSIRPNPRQPRAVFDQEKLRELSASITNHGVLQPVLVVEHTDGYILLAGERRMRAAELAGLTEIPALLTEATDEEMLEIALVENVQRDDLNAVEEARAYKALMDSFAWSHEQIAQRVGKNRSTVANSLRLLKLGGDALRDLESGRLTAGHARALLSLDDVDARSRLHKEIVNEGISVREAERRAIQFQNESLNPAARKASKKNISKAPEGLDTVALQDRLMEHLGCRVRVKSRDGRTGSVEVPFESPDELQRFLDFIKFSF